MLHPMDPLPLDPRAYGGTYKLVAGQLSLDLVNTVSWPGQARMHDWFDPVVNVVKWAVATGILDRGSAAQLETTLIEDTERAATELATARKIRSVVAGVLVPHVRGDAPSQRTVAALNRAIARANSRRHLDAESLSWTFKTPMTLEHVLAPAVLNAAQVLTEVDRERLGYCPSCDWLFHDTTRNGLRRWCDMADCGSRAKARRNYWRHRQ